MIYASQLRTYLKLVLEGNRRHQYRSTLSEAQLIEGFLRQHGIEVVDDTRDADLDKATPVT